MKRTLCTLLALLLVLLLPIHAVAAESDIFDRMRYFLENGLPMEAEQPTQNPPSSVSKEEALEALLDIPSLDFTLKNLEGEDVTLSDLQGKIVILSIWATWCGPCQGEMPIFEKVQAENDDLVVLAVHSAPYETGSESPSAAEAASAETLCREFITENGFTFPVLLDVDGSVSLSQTYITRGIPGNFVLDREGIIRYAQEGAYMNEESLLLVIDYVRALG